MRYAIIVVICMSLALGGCAHKRTARNVPVPPPPAGGRVAGASRSAPTGAPPQKGDQETGLASWYGNPYHGRAAANGEIYDMEQLVAAHRTLPFDTWVRVVNLHNSKAVEVRIIDRGPFVEGRIIDLSHAAARKLDLIGPGTVQVRLEVVRLPEVSATAVYAVQVGAFRDRKNAERMKAAMERYGPSRLVMRPGNPPVWRVLVGSESSEEDATALSNRIQQDSGERNAFVVRLDS
jgi:rare lipoprotein A